MTKPAIIQITRPSITGQCAFLVTVHASFSDIGFYTNGDGEETEYPLTSSETEEALKLLEPYDEHGRFIPFEPALCGPAANECADRAEANWRSTRLGK